MAVPSAPGDRPPRGMIDPVLHPPPEGFRAPPAEPVIPAPPLPAEEPQQAALFGAAPAGPGFRHAESPSTPTEPFDDVAEGADPAGPDDPGLDVLDDDQRGPSRVAGRVRGRPLQAAVLLLAVLVMMSGAGLSAILFRDARQTYTAGELLSALQAFRAPTGSAQTRSVTGSSEQLSVSPHSCTALVTQSPAEATDGAQWSSTDGTGWEAVQVQVVRFLDPTTARAVLRAMIDSSVDCDRMLVTWQDDSPRWVRLRSATSSTGVLAAREELSYALRSSYGGLVYVRQHGNVIAFVGGIGEVESGRQLTDDLVAELQSLSTG